MADPTGGLPGGIDPSNPDASNDSSLGADRAAAIEAEKKRWRDKQGNTPDASPKKPKREDR